MAQSTPQKQPPSVYRPTIIRMEDSTTRLASVLWDTRLLARLLSPAAVMAPQQQLRAARSQFITVAPRRKSSVRIELTAYFSGDYSCRETRVAADPVACESSISEYLTLYLEAYSSISGSFSSTSVTTVVSPGNVVFAEAVVVRRGADDPTWSGMSTTSSTVSPAGVPTANSTKTTAASASGNEVAESSATSSPALFGLSSSAKLGIGIGVALGALVFIGAITGVFVIMKKKKRRDYLEQVERSPDGQITPHKGPEELTDTGLHELPGQVPMAEMHTDSPPAELMGPSYWHK